MATWGSELKSRREKLRLSQYELAGRSGISREKISRFECGYTEPSSAERHRLEAAINETIAERYARLAELRLRADARKSVVAEEVTA